MNKFSFVVLSIAAAISVGGAAFANNDNDTLNRVSGYRQWTRVNPNPVEVTVPVTRIAGAVSIDAAALS
jgi:hypothetical protein